jgi:1-deoxy-D-xylulose-5-phosphate synthase
MARLLDTIDSPQDLKRLAVEDLPKVCQEIRDEIIETCSRNGGHLGSSLGAVEINVALHYVFDSPDRKSVV